MNVLFFIIFFRRTSAGGHLQAGLKRGSSGTNAQRTVLSSVYLSESAKGFLPPIPRVIKNQKLACFSSPRAGYTIHAAPKPAKPPHGAKYIPALITLLMRCEGGCRRQKSGGGGQWPGLALALARTLLKTSDCSVTLVFPTTMVRVWFPGTLRMARAVTALARWFIDIVFTQARSRAASPLTSGAALRFRRK